MNRQQETEELIILHRQRLHHLECRAAIQGLTAEPSTLIEIELIIAKIGKLEQELAHLQGEAARCNIQIDATTQLLLIVRADLTSEQAGATVGALANILNIPADQITVLQATTTHMTTPLELPTVAASRLAALHEADDFKLQDLGIQEVQLTQHKFDNVQ